MKKILFIILAAFTIVFTASAQNANYERKGNVFEAKASTSSKGEPTKTKFTWKDTKGNEYPVYISKSGSCFIIKTSSKTGKKYRNYLGPEISQEICKALGREYKNKNNIKS